MNVYEYIELVKSGKFLTIEQMEARQAHLRSIDDMQAAMEFLEYCGIRGCNMRSASWTDEGMKLSPAQQWRELMLFETVSRTEGMISTPPEGGAVGGVAL